MDNKEINVLIIEDNPADMALIREMLNESNKTRFKLYNAQRLKEGLDILHKEHIHVLLLDLNLPDSQGIETFHTTNEAISGIPIVIMSVFDDEDTAIEAVKGEAQDYLIKGKVDSTLLIRSIQYAIERKANELELINYRSHLEDMVEARTAQLMDSNEKLQIEIEDRKKAEKELKSSLMEKKILLEEIHNRVENNLLTISNLIGLEYSEATNKEPIEVYQDSQNRVKAVALIHEHFSRSEDFGIIDFGKYIQDLVNYLFKSFAVNSKIVNVNIDANGILLDIDTAVTCGLIINELVTNSIKHAFPSAETDYVPSEEYSIDINLCLNQNDYLLKVRDNGIGLPNDIDFRFSETTGMQMVNALVRQLDGLIDLKNNSGTEFKITFREFNV